MKVLITDSLSNEGVELLKNAGFEVKMDSSLDGESLKKEIPGYDGLIIRSGTTVTSDIIEASDKLKVIGRAGVGVDNVDVAAATRKGIIVMNTPGGNTISACEHTWALILSLLRNVPPAHQSLREGKWDKKSNKGTEIYGKTLGVVGLGKIGFEVARRAVGFGMDIIVYDPFTTEEAAKEVKARLVELDELLEKSDIITIHVPKNEKTKNLINSESIAKMKDGAFIVNCARGGIVNEADLAEAVKNGKIKGAAVDVYDVEPTTESPLFGVNGVIHTPHLGASTDEAQERVAIEIVKQAIGYLNDKKIVNAVNIFGAEVDPNVEALAHKLGALCGQLSGHLTERVLISYKEQVIGQQEETVVRSVLNGYLSQFIEGINFVNSLMVADERGIKVVRQRGSHKDLPGDVSVKLGDELEVSGMIIGDNQRLTGINDYILDIPLAGNLLIIKNNDIPGVIGYIGTILGEYNVNIGSMEVGRNTAGGQAVTVIGVDQELSQPVMEKLKLQESITDVNSVSVGQ
jgi:D-3-phosphoglycerate dehydrogenase